MNRRVVLTCFFILWLHSTCGHLVGEDSLVRNGNFEKWTNGLPDGWTVEIGAKNGADQPISTINQLEKAGLVLNGNAATMAWQSVSQDVKLVEKTAYNLTFQASAEEVKRQGRQYDNCYVGVMHFDANGKRLNMAVEDLTQAKNFKKQSIRFSVPTGTKRTSVLVFLSKSGTLKIKDLHLEEAKDGRPFRGSR